MEIVRSRLANVQSRKKGNKKVSMSMDEFIKKLETEISILTPEMVKNELQDLLQPEELPGLDRKIIGGIRKVIETLSEKGSDKRQ